MSGRCFRKLFDRSRPLDASATKLHITFICTKDLYAWRNIGWSSASKMRMGLKSGLHARSSSFPKKPDIVSSMKTTLKSHSHFAGRPTIYVAPSIQVLGADERDMQFVAEASNGREAIEQFRKHRPTCG